MHEQMIITEINKYIHEEIMGKCWHLWELIKPYNPNIPMDWKGKRCIKCSTRTIFNPNDNIEDYCSDNSPRRLLREVVVKVIEECGVTEMWLYFLRQAVTPFIEQDDAGRYVDMLPTEDDIIKLEATATAEQIARACVKAHKKGEKINV